MGPGVPDGGRAGVRPGGRPALGEPGRQSAVLSPRAPGARLLPRTGTSQTLREKDVGATEPPAPVPRFPALLPFQRPL